MEEQYCPKCKDYVEVEPPWEKVKCPKCGLEGHWDEDVYGDYSEDWHYIEWDSE